MFTANAAWLVLACIAFNRASAAGTLASPTLGKAVTATIRRKLINVAARVSTSARRITLHLPEHWPWEQGWTALFTSACGPPAPPPNHPARQAQPGTPVEHPGIEAHSATTPKTQKQNQTEIKIPSAADRWIQAQ